MKRIYLVTQPTHDDGDMADDAESVVAGYFDRNLAVDHASRIWAGHTTEVDVQEALPEWLASLPRDEERYARMGGRT